MANIKIIGNDRSARRWHHMLVERLAVAGHDVTVDLAQGRADFSTGTEFALRLEAVRFGASLATRSAPLHRSGDGPVDLVLDLVGHNLSSPVPVLRFDFGAGGVEGAFARLYATARLPQIVVRRDGVAVARACPMIDDPLWLTRGADKLLASAITLAEHTLARFDAGLLEAIADDEPSAAPSHLLPAYGPHLVTGLARRAKRKLRRGARPFYWQVGYRMLDETSSDPFGLGDGTAYRTLTDDGERFYADPFVWPEGERTLLFVEEFPYATGKGVISVAEMDADNRFGTPRVIIEEPYHLSYPQVVGHGDEVFMIPEGSSGKELVLYRARALPDDWVRDTVLLSGVEISDATLITQPDGFWLIGTQRHGAGSHSDTMVAYHSPDIRGPYAPHRLNPILIDRRAARPGGRPLSIDGQVFVPFQDGTTGYGGGLGFSRLVRLDEDLVDFAPPKPVADIPGRPGVGIHTLNRAGGVEVIDWSGGSPRPSADVQEPYPQ